jgi:hypothetical protein
MKKNWMAGATLAALLLTPVACTSTKDADRDPTAGMAGGATADGDRTGSDTVYGGNGASTPAPTPTTTAGTTTAPNP